MKRPLAVLSILLFVPVILNAARVSVIRLPADNGSSNPSPADRDSAPVSVQRQAEPAANSYEPSRAAADTPSSWSPRSAYSSDISRSFQVAERPSARARVVRQAGTSAPSHAVFGNRSVVRSIERQRRVEVVPNRAYWHTVRGVRYSHYYRGGAHWYGFYSGPRFYWSRYYGNCWWWRDPSYDRWAFWSEGYWWWPGPTGLYVYVNDGYYPYEPGVVPVARPAEIPESPQDAEAPPAELPADASSATPAPAAAPLAEVGHTWTSPDNKRQVQLVGPNGEAFLYDNSSGKPVFMKFLAKDVEKVRFSEGTNRKPLQILVDFKDGHFEIYDLYGKI